MPQTSGKFEHKPGRFNLSKRESASVFCAAANQSQQARALLSVIERQCLLLQVKMICTAERKRIYQQGKLTPAYRLQSVRQDSTRLYVFTSGHHLAIAQAA